MIPAARLRGIQRYKGFENLPSPFAKDLSGNPVAGYGE